jgi:hypothetical protein
MELQKVSEEILNKIHLLEVGRKELKGRGLNKAAHSAEYEKVLGITMLKLRNNAIDEFEGMPCQNLPAGMIEKVARSICWEAKLNMDTAEVEYKNAVVGIHAIESEMNGLQSLNKYLTEV